MIFSTGMARGICRLVSGILAVGLTSGCGVEGLTSTSSGLGKIALREDADGPESSLLPSLYEGEPLFEAGDHYTTTILDQDPADVYFPVIDSAKPI